MNSKRFLTIPAAAKETGLSAYFLRRGIKAGTIPFIMSGNRYLIDVVRLIKQLEGGADEK